MRLSVREKNFWRIGEERKIEKADLEKESERETFRAMESRS